MKVNIQNIYLETAVGLVSIPFEMEVTPVTDDRHKKWGWVNYYHANVQFADKWRNEPIKKYIDLTFQLTQDYKWLKDTVESHRIKRDLPKDFYRDLIAVAVEISTDKRIRILWELEEKGWSFDGDGYGTRIAYGRWCNISNMPEDKKNKIAAYFPCDGGVMW